MRPLVDFTPKHANMDNLLCTFQERDDGQTLSSRRRIMMKSTALKVNGKEKRVYNSTCITFYDFKIDSKSWKLKPMHIVQQYLYKFL